MSTAHSEKKDNEAESVCCESDSSWQRKHNQPDQSNKELQPITATEQRGSETTEGGKDPNLSPEGTQPSEDSQQEMDKQVPSDEHKGDNKDTKGNEEGMDQNNPQSIITTKPCNRNTDSLQEGEGTDTAEYKAEAKAKSDFYKPSKEEEEEEKEMSLIQPF